MGAATDPSAMDADRGWRVLIAVDRDSNRELLVDWFDDRGDYEVCTHKEGLPDAFDICLIDVSAYRQLATELAERRAATQAYLPVMLMVSGRPDADQWAWVGDQLGEFVDDVTTLPIRQEALTARIRVLLRSRELSLDLVDQGRELAEARHRLELAVQASDQTVWELNLATDMVQMYGTTTSHVGLGETFSLDAFFDQIDSDDRARVEQVLADAVADVGQISIEARYVDATTDERGWLHMDGEVQTGADGEPTRVVGTSRDVTARKERERELERAQARLERAVVASDLRVWELDVDGGEVTIHRWYDESLLGIRVNRFEDVEVFLEHVHPEETARVRDAFTTAVEDGTTLEETFRIPHFETGDVRWLELRAERRELGDELKLVGTARDVTEQVERERDLERALDRLTRAQAIANIGAWEYDITDDELQWTEGTYAVHGVPKHFEPTTEAVADLYHPEDRSELVSAFQGAIETGKPFDRRIRLPSDGDGQRWVRVQSEVICDDEGPTLLRGTVQEVTDQVERERELERYELVVRTAGDPIYTVDSDGRLAMVNDAVLEVTDRPPEAVEGAPVSAVFGSNHAETLADRVTRLLAGDEQEGTVATTVTLPDGSRRIFQTRIAVVPFEGAFRGYACVSRDVTDLREHQRRLSVLDRVLRHNLRNTMNVVLGHADTLTDAPDPGIRETAAAIVEAGEELLSLGEAARRFQDTIDPHVDTTVETDLGQHVRHVVEEQRLDHPGATFLTDLSGTVRARTPEALDLALSEVIENAVVHCDHDDPQVEVSVETEDGSAVVRVADNGPGVERLTRLALDRGSESPLEHASGLGLWLVRWTVAASDGSLDISERVPRGTVVELRFPLAE